jgi:flagellar biosynthesis anti-sigma factor FlgM
MKVENSQNNRIVQKQTEGMNAIERNAKTTENERTDKLTNKDQASLSERAKMLAKARIKLEEQPQTRADKVTALREQIQNGLYQIPVEQLASIFLKGLRS